MTISAKGLMRFVPAGQTRLVAGLGAAALMGVALVTGHALAQSTPPPQARTGGAAGQQRPAPFDRFLALLAGRLGRSEVEVRAAVADAQRELIQEEAQERLRNGPLPFAPVPGAAGMRPGQQTAPWQPGFHGQPGQAVGPMTRGQAGAAPLLWPQQVGPIAAFLGMAPAELERALRSGRSLAEVAQERGKSRDELRTALIDAVLDARVATPPQGQR